MTRSHRHLAILILGLTVLVPIGAIIYHRLTPSSDLFSNPFSSPNTMTSQSASSPPVIVVGSGLAGLAAAYTALKSSASSVLMLERAQKPGGNSIKASSGINGAPTKYQHQQQNQGSSQDQADEIESFLDDTYRSAGSRLASSDVPPALKKHREALISVLVHNSTAAIDFLTQDLGIDLSVVAQLGGHSHARTHRGAGKTPPGASIVTTLLAKLKEFGDDSFALKTGHEVTRILADPTSGQVTGVEYKPTGDSQSEPLIALGPVIFTAGGFAGDTHGLLSAYRPDLAGLPSTNEPRPGAHALLTDVGARLVDMDSVQIHPTGFVDPANPDSQLKFLAAEMLRGEGGILLRGGRRFVNELDTREKVSGVIMGMEPLARGEGEGGEGGKLRQWDVQILLDPGATEAAAGHVGFYLWKGLLRKVKVGELDEVTRDTLREYARAVKGEKEDEFGRRAFGHWRLALGEEPKDDDEVCVGSVTPITHFTMGGVVFNDRAQVLKTELGQEPQTPIGGIWAAGEITGGIHGDNRLGGSSLLECVVFGRIAGEQAAKAALGK